ncbi:MAG: cytidine deaminase [Schwartzia sp.]|nr:cytidine deaminase [Schwartzia sp. (in: firmicutes)]MBR1760332.1 cytidine deaminase [Schwartzia sp. (in: firmicutes)]MBR1885231.1 cytidine deaminase [Schwartzia sp. (in: firmicutes)]
MTEVDKKLIAEAKRVREFAYCPYSNFAVGAAVLGESGTIYGGCNVENASFSVTNCAERTAIYKAVSAGEKDILALAVVAQGAEPVPPCGACRQVIAEFNIPHILMANLADDVVEMTLDELLPGAFSASNLEE